MTRRCTSTVEALCRFLPLVVGADAPNPPARVRFYLRDLLQPDGTSDPSIETDRWLVKWGLSLGS